MLTCATPSFLRHCAHTYLRLQPQLRAAWWLAAVLLAGVITACIAPPPSAIALVAPFACTLWRAYLYWCSMLAGAAPYIVAGSLAGMLVEWLLTICKDVRRCHSALRLIAPVGAALFSGCDCSLLGFAGSLRDAPRWLSGFALTWGACCNPIALFCTARILGEQIMLVRLCGGCLAALLTAVWLARLADAGKCDQQPAACARLRSHSAPCSLKDYAALGFASFTLSAAIAAIILAFGQNIISHTSPLVAALAGGLISPCSSADALLARALFRGATQQVAFIMAAQCLDVRQLLLWRTHFGFPATRAAASAAGVATCLCCLIVSVVRL